MRLRIKVLSITALAIGGLAGCEEPKEVVPVAPPGFEIVRQPTVPDGEAAQALGEQPAAALAAQSSQPRQKVEPRIVANSPPTPINQPTTTPSGLIYETLKEGDGAVAKSGDAVLMHYTGTFADGKKFDSSVGRDPLPVTLGMGGVIQGWDEGIPGMKVGEKRKLTIPPKLGYGSTGKGSIPPDSTLLFEVELVKIQ